jgi:hypothetical protein
MSQQLHCKQESSSPNFGAGWSVIFVATPDHRRQRRRRLSRSVDLMIIIIVVADRRD